MMAEAEKLEEKADPEKAVEAYLAVLVKTDAFKDPELLLKSYRGLARAGYRLNVFYTEKAAELYIEAMEAAEAEDTQKDEKLRKQADEFAQKAKQALMASQRYDKKMRQGKQSAI